MNENNINNNQVNFNNLQQPMNNNSFQTLQQPTYDQQPTKKNSIKKILLIIIAIVVIVLLVFFIKHFIGGETGDKNNASTFSVNSLIAVEKDGKYGYIDLKGNFVIQPQYDYATSFYGDYAEVAIENEVDGQKVKTYQVIDKAGNVKMTTSSAWGIEHKSEYDIWIINNQLYNGSLKKLSADGVKVTYEDEGYLIWENDTNKTAGIMNSSGKVTYTYKFADGESYIGVDTPDNDKTLKEKYCRITIDNKKYAIVNCDTGKVAYDYTDKYISLEDDNIFKLTTKDTFEFVSIMYIQNDKVIYESSNKNVDLYYSGRGYVRITDDDKDYNERYSYIDISTGQITDSEPESSSNSNYDLDEWEEYTKITKFNCSSGYGLMSGENTKIPCEWSNIKYFDLSLYKYLSSKGKEYVMAEKDGKIYLLNLKDGKSVAEFNAFYINTYGDTTFIYYKDQETGKRIIYNLITGKSLTTEYEQNAYLYSNYMTLEEDGKLNYYNTDFELFYSQE